MTRRSRRACSHPGDNEALASARGTARSEPQLIVRSLKRLHGPIAHGWYVALRGTSDARYERFRARLAPDYDGRDVRHVRARAHARSRADAARVRACRAARLRGGAGAVGAGARAEPAGLRHRRGAARRTARSALRASGTNSAASTRRPTTPLGPARREEQLAEREQARGQRAERDQARPVVADGEHAIAAQRHQHRHQEVGDRRSRAGSRRAVAGMSTMQSTTFVNAAMPVTTQLSCVRLTRPTATPTT